MKINNSRKKILDQTSYWVEGINGFLYNSIIDYMENNNLNRTKLAQHLGISKGRVSQILNDGEINFSLEKLIEITLKVDKYPVLELIDKESFLKEELLASEIKSIIINPDHFFEPEISKRKLKTKVVPLKANTSKNIEIHNASEYATSGT